MKICLPKLPTAPEQRKPAEFWVGTILFLLLGGLLSIHLLLSALETRFHIDITPQSVSCLPWSVFVTDLEPVPHPYLGEAVMAHTHKAFQNERLGKLVIGLPGDSVLETRQGIWVNGHYWGRLWLYSWLVNEHHRVPKLPDHFVVPPGTVLLLGTNPMSWDGRYWGLVPIRNLYGRIFPL